QWGNIVTGIDLGRRMGTSQLYGLTSPLLTTASGAKMGKTAQGAIWLDERMLPVFEYWQYWRNCEDQDIGRFLRLFTELPLDEIARLEALGGSEINEAKKVLATEATALVHGREAAMRAAEAARQTFEEGALADNLPSIEISAAEIEAGLGVLTAFVKAGLVASTGEARRQIKAGGIRINGEAVTDERMIIGPGQLMNGAVKLSLGRKRHVLLKVA
ncbi:MAG TPA: tyrosine--tRNA ligase, partial [Methylocella sp.]|nr:tyrosine--tRNA ligase [Methylocella sp.]